jgi:hypothetical protein
MRLPAASRVRISYLLEQSDQPAMHVIIVTSLLLRSIMTVIDRREIKCQSLFQEVELACIFLLCECHADLANFLAMQPYP